MRTHSLAVDITNYVMLDLGYSRHAYDLDKVAQPVVVRRANEGEKLSPRPTAWRARSRVEDLVIAADLLTATRAPACSAWPAIWVAPSPR